MPTAWLWKRGAASSWMGPAASPSGCADPRGVTEPARRRSQPPVPSGLGAKSTGACGSAAGAVVVVVVGPAVVVVVALWVVAVVDDVGAWTRCVVAVVAGLPAPLRPGPTALAPPGTRASRPPPGEVSLSPPP